MSNERSRPSERKETPPPAERVEARRLAQVARGEQEDPARKARAADLARRAAEKRQEDLAEAHRIRATLEPTAEFKKIELRDAPNKDAPTPTAPGVKKPGDD